MKISFHYFILPTFIIFLLSCQSGPVEVKNEWKPKDTVQTQTKPGLIPAAVFSRKDKTPFEDYYVMMEGKEYTCTYNGKISVSDTLKKNTRPVTDLKTEFMVDAIFLSRHDSDYFLVWQETGHEGVRSFFASFPDNDNTPKWKLGFTSPNPVQPVIDGKFAYVATLGMVGKLDLDAGKFVWKHDSLFNQKNGAFKELEPPIVYDDRVIFVDKPIPGKRPKRDSLVLDPVTGERIR